MTFAITVDFLLKFKFAVTKTRTNLFFCLFINSCLLMFDVALAIILKVNTPFKKKSFVAH